MKGRVDLLLSLIAAAIAKNTAVTARMADLRVVPKRDSRWETRVKHKSPSLFQLLAQGPRGASGIGWAPVIQSINNTKSKRTPQHGSRKSAANPARHTCGDFRKSQSVASLIKWLARLVVTSTKPRSPSSSRANLGVAPLAAQEVERNFGDTSRFVVSKPHLM
jgi:hypothetical protein